MLQSGKINFTRPREKSCRDMNCISINIQRADCRDKLVWIRSLFHKHKVNFLSIQESKLSNVDFGVVCFFWGNSSSSHVFSPSRGASGGNITIWDPVVISHNNIVISYFFVMVEATWWNSGLNIMFISV